MFDLTATAHYLPQLLAGLFTTLWVSLTAIALGLVVGWAVCLGLMGEHRWLRMFCAAYVSFFKFAEGEEHEHAAEHSETVAGAAPAPACGHGH